MLGLVGEYMEIHTHTRRYIHITICECLYAFIYIIKYTYIYKKVPTYPDTYNIAIKVPRHTHARN